MKGKSRFRGMYAVACWFVLGLMVPFLARAQAPEGPPEIILQIDPNGEILATALSPDEKLLATLGKDGAVNLWDVQTGKLQHRFIQLDTLGWRGTMGNLPNAHVRQELYFSPTGNTLAYFGFGTPMYVWDVATGKQLEVPRGRIFSGFKFSHDGKILLGMARNGQVILWEVKTGEVKVTLNAHKGAVSNVALSADGLQLLTVSSEDKTVKRWNWRTQELVQVIDLAKFGGDTWLMSPDGRSLAVADEGSDTLQSEMIKIWDTQTWTMKRQFSGYATVMNFSPNSKFLAAMCVCGEAAILELASGVVKKLDLQIVRTDRQAMQKKMEAGNDINEASTILDSLEIRKLVNSGNYLDAFTFTADSQFFKALRWDGKLAVWNARTGEKRPPVPALQPVTSIWQKLAASHLRKPSIPGKVVFTQDALTIGFYDQWLQLKWQDALTLESSLSVKKREGLEASTDGKVIESPNGQLKAKLNPNGDQLELMEVSTGKRLHKFLVQESFFNAVQFSPDSQHLFTETISQQSMLAEQAIIIGRSGIPDQPSWRKELIEMMKLSQIEKMRIVEKGQSIKVWNIETGSQIADLHGYVDRVWEMQFSADGKTLITSHPETKNDQTYLVARLWDWRQGKLKRRIPKRFDFRPDNSIILSSEDAACDDECRKKTSAEIEQLKKEGKKDEAEALASTPPQNKRLLAWDVASGENLWNLPLSEFRSAGAMTFSPNGNLMGNFWKGAEQGFQGFDEVRQGELNLWETATGKLLHRQVVELKVYLSDHHGATFSSSGRFFAVSSSDQFFVWDVLSAKLTANWRASPNYLLSNESFSPDDRLVASIGIDNSIQIRNPASGKLLVTITLINPLAAATPQQQKQEWIAYTPDGYYTGSDGIEKHIHWQVQGQFQASAPYISTYRRPEIVKAALQGKR